MKNIDPKYCPEILLLNTGPKYWSEILSRDIAPEYCSGILTVPEYYPGNCEAVGLLAAQSLVVDEAGSVTGC